MKQTPFPLNLLQHLLAPQNCVVCGRIVINSDLSQVCPDCFSGLAPLHDPVCRACGRPLPGGKYSIADTCAECRSDPPAFDRARAWGPYQGDLRKILLEFKYGGLKTLAGPLSELLCAAIEEQFDIPFDWIAPVPLHRIRLRERGYDQALLLARKVARKTGIPVLRGLSRTRETRPQFGLSSRERRDNTKGAFSFSPTVSLEDSGILVLDDVFTTGSTVSSLCKCLRKGTGAGFIGVLTVARAVRHGPK